MTRLRRTVGAAERMDAPDVDPGVLRASLGHITAVNRWLGARRALLRHLPWAIPARGRDGGAAEPGERWVLDVGTGSGDLAGAMDRWARAKGRTVRVVALDVHAGTVAVAREQVPDRIRLVRGDGLALPFPDGAFDLVHLGMTLHHMEGEAVPGLLREAARVAQGGRILVGELERSLPNYLGARLLAATLWRSNRITRHDGPLSVLRAFTPGELLAIGRQAGLDPTVHRHPFYRLVLRAEA